MYAEPHTVAELARALESRALTATLVTERCLRAIAERNPSLNAFTAVFADEALTQARQADADIAEGQYRGPLHGVPISLKDLIDVSGVPTTAASRVRNGHVASSDATIVRRLRAAGAVLIGKTNLHEFALGTTNEDSAFGPAHHPLDPTRSPGGSSGGSAASVAADMAYASIGTDTGGSIRIPAAACGLVGLKPAFGDVPIDGVVPLSTTLDHVGPLCRSVEDAQILYDVLRGHEPANHLRQGYGGPPQLHAKAEAGPYEPRHTRGMRLGVLRGYFTALLDPEVASGFESACERLHAAGVELQDVAIAHAGDIASIYVHIVLSEAAAYHAATLEGRADDYTPNVRLRLEMGRYILAEDYVRALRGREILRAEVDAALSGRDGLLLPSMAVPATRLGADTVRVGGSDEPVRNITLRLTQLFNITGHPAITVPCGTTTQGLPVGAQIAGGMETTALLQLARALEPYLGPGISR